MATISAGTVDLGAGTYEVILKRISPLSNVSKGSTNTTTSLNMNASGAGAGTGGGKKSKKDNATRKMNGGKRKLSGYMKFAQEVRPRIMKDEPNLKFTDIGRKIGAQWRALSDAEKAKY